jgi:undecaprenyl diphosphate synthase
MVGELMMWIDFSWLFEIRENIEVRCVGDHSMLPESLRNVIATLEESTKHNTGLKLSIALSYSGRQDIVSACKRLMGQVQNGEISSSDMTEAAIDEELQTSWVGEARDPDLLIRTSGEQRISNFMLWQTAYTEFLFVDSLWPDFGETQLKDALIEYQKRNRRFGKHGN